MRFVVHCSTETVEARGPQYDHNDHEHEAELWFVDSAVAPGEFEADPVVHGAGDGFANDAEDEGA